MSPCHLAKFVLLKSYFSALTGEVFLHNKEATLPTQCYGSLLHLNNVRADLLHE